MQPNQYRIEELLRRMDALKIRQDNLSAEYEYIRATLEALTDPDAQQDEPPRVQLTAPTPPAYARDVVQPAVTPAPAPVKQDMERFIGENLSNKIGAFIVVLGVGIGIKYVIDNDLIGPTMRIALGYLTAVVMFVISQQLRGRYRDLSAVIMGASLCIAYFSTYAAYTYYQLMPQSVAFVLMLLTTLVTVWQSLVYDRQVVAVSGLIGAYYIPFLLGDAIANPVFLFSYISIVNTGILYLSFRRDWLVLRYFALVISWIILISWVFNMSNQRDIGLCFSTVFFVIFTAIYLVEKWLKAAKHRDEDTVWVVFNGFCYFITGNLFVLDYTNGDSDTLVFVFANLLIYLGISYRFFQNTQQERPFGLFSRMAIFMAVVFLAVQFDYDVWWYVAWAILAASLFFIGRFYKLSAYETSFIPLGVLLLASGAIYTSIEYNSIDIQNPNDFSIARTSYLTPIFNYCSLAYFVTIVAFVSVLIINKRIRYAGDQDHPMERIFPNAFSDIVLTITLLLTYLYLFQEIAYYFNYASFTSEATAKGNLMAFKRVCLIGYSMLFLTIINFIAVKQHASPDKKGALVILSWLCIPAFLTIGLYNLGYLKNAWLYEHHSLWFILVRYIALALLGGLCWSLYHLIRQERLPQLGFFDEALDLMLHGVALWVASSELVYWLELTGHNNMSYKTALSILFGCWSVVLIVTGIRRNRKSYRVAALTLFAITLFKLFFYDLAHISSISKTIVMVSLGSLLLLISYFYNKAKE
jgi:uncharacterized membrane protein